MKSLPPVQRARLQLIALFLLFTVPIGVSTWLALSGSWRPVGSAHHGELLNPAQPLAELAGQQFDGASVSLDDLRGRWVMVYLGSTPDCGEICQERLYYMRQIRHALGRHMQRVQTLGIFESIPEESLNHWLREQHPQMLHTYADASVHAEFAAPFTTPSEETHWIYLLDPLGNRVMRYSRDIEPDHILDDIERLLKYSKIG